MTVTAWATTSTNPLGADSGISVHDETSELDRTNVEPGALDIEDGALDTGMADVLLDGPGYRRTEPWRESGGQWGAAAEPTA